MGSAMRGRSAVGAGALMSTWMHGCGWGGGEGGDFFGDDLVDDLVDAVFGAGLGDGDDALGLAGGDVLVGGVDATVEVVGLALEAVLVGAGGLDGVMVAAAGAGKGGFERGKEEEGEVWLEVVTAEVARWGRGTRSEPLAGGRRPDRPRRSR